MSADTVVSKGPLTPVGGGPLGFWRYPATGAAAALVRHYWIPEWTLPPGETREIPILVYPACNLVVEPHRCALYGPSPRLDVQRLEGAGWAFGALLQLATGHRLAGRPVAEIVSAPLSLEDEAVTDAVRAAMSAPGAPESRHPRAIAAFQAWLLARLPRLGAEELLVNAVGAAVEADAALTRVDELARRFGLSERRLERLVARYTGHSPKWLIRRRRLQDAAQLLRADPDADLSRLAAELGYADYPHFSRDFAATVGATPREFTATARRAPG